MSVMYKKQSAFTIVELLIVIVVIAILAAISVVAYTGVQQRARDSERKADLATIARAIELYKADNGVYPLTTNLYWCTQIANPSYPAVKTALQAYIKDIPQDPTYHDTNQDYFYRNLGGNSYDLYAQMEATSNGSYNSGPCASIGSTQGTYNFAYGK